MEARSKDPIVSGYFGKLYNQDWLRAIGHASIRDTLDYVQSKDVVVYRSAAISDQGAFPFGSVAAMPWDIDREWHRADRPTADAPCGFLAGLYLGEKTRGMPSLARSSAIVVREDAARWTLVHEFMHHNFKAQAENQGYDDDVVQAKRISLLQRIGGLQGLKKDKKVSDRDYAQRLASFFSDLIDVADQFVVQYQFEEVTVEATLQDAYLAGELTYVPFGAFQNASWYIAHSRKNAEEMYRGMTTTYEGLSRLLSENGLDSMRPGLDRYIELRDRRLAQLDEVIAKRQSYLFGTSFARRMSVVPAGGRLPCARAREIDREMKEIAEALRPARDRT